MRFQILLLIIMVVCTIGLVGYIHSRRKEEGSLTKQNSFQNVKNRVTRDVLKEYQTHVEAAASQKEKSVKEVEDLKEALKKEQEAADGKKAELDTCTGDLKRLTDEAASVDTEKTNKDNEFKKKKAGLDTQIANLKKELEQRSKVCDYINKDSNAEAKKLCGIEEEKKEEKNEEKKEEAPKP